MMLKNVYVDCDHCGEEHMVRQECKEKLAPGFLSKEEREKQLRLIASRRAYRAAKLSVIAVHPDDGYDPKPLKR